MTFISIADPASTSNAQKSARNFANAHKALTEIQKGLATPDRHGLNEDQVIFLEARSKEIEMALAGR
jgi:hypothetical protein